jgi:phosphohistidine phosphatase
MMLYLLRHGIAVNIGEQGVTSDPDRMLSARGRKRTENAVRGLAAMGCRPERVLSSPLVRAWETAEIAAGLLCEDLEVERSDRLLPEADSEKTAAWLEKQPDKDTMLVGHMPGLAVLASRLLTATEDTDITLKKAAVLCIRFDGDVETGQGRLEWLIQPRALRQIAGP